MLDFIRTSRPLNYKMDTTMNLLTANFSKEQIGFAGTLNATVIEVSTPQSSQYQ